MSKFRVPVRMLIGAMLASMALVTASCGDDTAKGAVSPEAKVQAKQKALDDANAAFTASAKQFCADTKDYIVALDRYGNVFSTAAVTVGDVQTAGKDLEKPRSTVEAGAPKVVSARDDVATAEQELADAKAAASGTTTTASDEPATTTTTLPLLPPATVDRVKKAEADLATAAEGITPATPLADAAASYNAAAFALQVAWLRLFNDAGCFTDEQQATAVTTVVNYTVALQNQLTVAGFFTGDVDGVYGPETVEAVSALQTQAGLPITGFVDRATNAALDAILAGKGGTVATQQLITATAVQTALKLAGFWEGPVDGQWTDALTASLKSFQTSLGVPPTGNVDTITLDALRQAIEDAKAAVATTTTGPEAETTEAPTDETTTTSTTTVP